jgi:hypothetical protein
MGSETLMCKEILKRISKKKLVNPTTVHSEILDNREPWTLNFYETKQFYHI